MTESIFRSCIIGCITACTLLFLANCSPDDGGKIDDGKTDDGETDEPSTDDSSRRPPFDAVTSATPDVAQAELDPTHPGWMQAGCATCHDSTHVGNYVVPDCVFCHGRNGAPDRVAPHADNNCRDCHGDSHGDIELASPETCRTCHHYQKSASCGNTETLDVVVIGAGGGGLAAAAALARAGKKIVLLERQYKLGGQMGIIRRGPYNIELSLHSMSGLTEGMIPAEMFEQLGIWDTLKPVTLDPLFRIVSSDSDYSVPADYQTYLDVLQKEFPEEAENLARLFEDLSGLSVLIEAAMVFQSTGEMPSHVTPEDLMELEKLLNTSVSDFVYGYIENTRLFGVVTSLTVYMGKLPQEMSALTFVAIWKGFQLDGLQYLEGGSETIINALADIIRENGNTIELQTEATKILIDEEGKATQVQTQDGRCFNTRHVVSNANAPATLFEMVGEEHLPDDYVKRVKEMEQSPSMFVIYLGVDRDYVPEFGGGHELFMGEHADNDVTLENILECRVDEVGFAMTNYSAVDPKAAPLGKNAITIITMLPFECFDNWQWDTSHEAYRKQKAEVAEIILSKAETILPDLMSHIEVMEIATPQTIRAYTLNPRGSILGWADTLEQNILTRLEQQTPIPNLWLAGAWTNPGGGQQYVLSSGLTAAKSVIEALKETP